MSYITVRWSEIGSPTRPCNLPFQDGWLIIDQLAIDTVTQVGGDPCLDLEEFRPAGANAQVTYQWVKVDPYS